MKSKFNILVGITASLFFVLTVMFGANVKAAKITSNQSNKIAAQYNAKKVPVKEAKKYGAKPVKINSSKQLKDFLNDKYVPTTYALATLIPSWFNIFGKTLTPSVAQAATTTKTTKKRLWPGKYSTTHIYGYVRFSKKGKKISKVKNSWTQQTGLLWPISWHQSAHWTHINKGRKSGKATFKGSRYYYIMIPNKELAYSRATTFHMSF